MIGKECERMKRIVGWALIAAWGFAVSGGAAYAGEGTRRLGSGLGAGMVRLWPTAVVTGDRVTLGDICDFSALEPEVRAKLATAFIANSPQIGASKQLRLDDVHLALRQAGANLAAILLTGSTTCKVSRPTVTPAAFSSPTHPSPTHARTTTPQTTLADVVRGVFEQQTRRYGGVVNIQFGRTSPQLLSLAEPEYQFVVRSKSGQWVGRLIPIEVGVSRDGKDVRTVPLIVASTITREVVVARRAINQKAVIHYEDVELTERTYDHVGDFGTTRLDEVVGLRAKRFIAADQVVRAADLESVPLVRRGQVVEVISTAGRIEIRSAAKALGGGALGDVIELRSGPRRGSSITGIIVGPGRVRIGRATATARGGGARLALGANR